MSERPRIDRTPWTCPLCGVRRRGDSWGHPLSKRTAFLRWEVTYEITPTWLEAGTRVCYGHDSAERMLEERRKILASGAAAHPDALAREIRRIEEILA